MSKTFSALSKSPLSIRASPYSIAIENTSGVLSYFSFKLSVYSLSFCLLSNEGNKEKSENLNSLNTEKFSLVVFFDFEYVFLVVILFFCLFIFLVGVVVHFYS